MPIPFKSILSSAVANQTWLDKTVDDAKKGKFSLYKTLPTDTDAIDDIQEMINTINSDLGRVGEVDPNSNTYSSEEIIANGDNRKVAIGKLDEQVKENLDVSIAQGLVLVDHEGRISTNETNISTNTSDIGAINSSLGQPNGIATLDGGGKVPAIQLPSYVDDVEEYADLASFPVTGESGKIYVAIDTGKTYRWSGSIYTEISPSDVNSVNGQTGIVVLDKTNIGLSNVTDDAQLKREAGDINTFTEKVLPVAADVLLIEDSEDSFNKKKIIVSNLPSSSGGSFSTVTKTSTATLLVSGEENVLLDSTSGDFVLSLPTAIGNSGVTYNIKKIVEVNKVTLDTFGSEEIDGELTLDIPSINDSIQVTSNGSNWFLLKNEILISARYTSNSGQGINSTASPLICEDIDHDTHGFYDPITGLADIPAKGVYKIDSNILTNSVAMNISESTQLSSRVNGTTISSSVRLNVVNAATSVARECYFGDELHLEKGDELAILKFNTQGSSLSTSPIYNYISITKVG